MREDEIEVLQKELEDKAEELSELSQESKTLLQQAGLELKKDANKQKELEDNLKIEKQKTQVLEDKVFGLEEQKQEILGLLATIGEPGSPVQDNGEGLLAELEAINAQLAQTSGEQQPLSDMGAMKAQFDASTNDGYNS